MAKILIVSGSPNRQSRLYGLIEEASIFLAEAGHHVETLHVAELPAEDLLRANFGSEAVKSAQALVAEADAVIVASPVYKAAYSGILKTFLDLVPERGLDGKLTLPLFVGGTIAHLLAVEYALKPVLAALGSRHILGGVYAVDQSIERRQDGGFLLNEEAAARLERSLRQLAEELDWNSRRKLASASGQS